MVKQAGLAELGDVTLSGFLRYAERSGGLEIGGAVKGIRKGCVEGLTAVVGVAMAIGLAELVTWQGLKDRCRVLQQDFDHRQGGGKVGIGTFKDRLRLLAFHIDDRQWEGAFVHLAEHCQDHREAKEDEAKATDRSNDVVAEDVGVLHLRQREEIMEPLPLAGGELEMDDWL